MLGKIKKIRFDLIATGLAIFSMLFGAGNLMYPIAVGLASGKYTLIGLTGFLITAVLLPLMGLVAMILYNGDYRKFFGRLGKTPGKIMIAICMIIIGPGLVIPRIVSVAHVMISSFFPFEILRGTGLVSLFLFSIIFLGITFLGSFKENNIVDILGYVISPVLLISLATMIIKGMITAENIVATTGTPLQLFKDNIFQGYQTLDLLGTLFFASIIITILKSKLYDDKCNQFCLKKLAMFGLKAGAIGVSLLAIVYFGMSFLAAYHGHGLGFINAGEAFKIIAFRVIGTYGAAILGIATLMACLSTSIGLSAVTADYIQKNIFKNKIGYLASLVLVLVACIPLSTYGLDAVLAITGGPIVFIGYPVLIALTFCNILYKLFGFKYVKAPVLATFMITFAAYYLF
ncbi:branched-chain amino acid transport system II carrier protein [Candidatus Dependentiae bacterium]